MDKLSRPILIEDQGGKDGVDWIVSFDGIHPHPDDCVLVPDSETGTKIIGLVERLLAQ